MEDLFSKLEKKEIPLAIIGLGYVGLPLALACARKFKVIGFDIHAGRVEMMQKGIDPSNELSAEDFKGTDITFTYNADDLNAARFFIIAVPTPVDEHNAPDLTALRKSSATVGGALKQGDYVVYESTVYPGCTEEVCIPVLEEVSGLRGGVDFFYGYSPERINPGDKERTIDKITKVVSGNSQDACKVIAQVYGAIIPAGIFQASSVKVAEAAKVIENTQRDINISFMNELTIIFDKIGISTSDVLDAANTKWNFLKFYPGLVGGHCIGVDPYYLAYKSTELGHRPKVILSGREVNDYMPQWLASKCIQMLVEKNVNPLEAKICVLGITFKENVTDIRNSKVADLIKELEKFRVKVHVMDPDADAKEVEHEYGISMVNKVEGGIDVIILAVAHDVYRKISIQELKAMGTPNTILMDLKGIRKGEWKSSHYWSM